MKKILLYAAIGYGIYYIIKKYSSSVSLSGPRRGLAFGEPRMGRPKTEAERKATHFEQFGTYDLPPRGTGLNWR